MTGSAAPRINGAFAAALGVAIFGGLAVDAAKVVAADMTLRCAPAYPTYCANIHVACAGRSRLATATFDLRIDAGGAVVIRDGARERRGVVDDRGRKILRPTKDPSTRAAEAADDWIVIEPDGRFAERIHRGGAALMSRGRCAPLE